MIIVCEPQCKGIMHEKVNSGFIYGLRLAYPQEKIIFFADETHISAIKDILENDGVSVVNFECEPIKFETSSSKIYSFIGVIRYYLLFKKLFNKMCNLGTDKVFFLSNNPIILYTIKKLRQRSQYREIYCTFVLHGEFEDLARGSQNLIKHMGATSSQVDGKEDGERFANQYKKIFIIISKILLHPVCSLTNIRILFYRRIFWVKKIMLWQHSNHYRYIALSPHIVKNARQYLDPEYLNFSVVIMPIIYKRPYPQPENEFIKFAVFGSGDSHQMHMMLSLLSKKEITARYEIKIISADRRGSENFPNISYVNHGKVLARKEMEKAVPDVDVFINLYDINHHKLGCSLSIFEALSYLKPVLHLSNDSYNYFNKADKPIGFRCENLNDFVDKMYDMIENYSSYKDKLNTFRNNMQDIRDRYTIENNIDDLRNSFAF